MLKSYTRESLPLTTPILLSWKCPLQSIFKAAEIRNSEMLSLVITYLSYAKAIESSVPEMAIKR